ncbi:MAG: TetR/AcrR family transcriptional regulator [Pseudomonadota bacterium]
MSVEFVGEPGECRSSRGAERRRRIADTARRLFVEKGFHGTGVALIAAESGIGVGQLYRDFAGKEAIVADIVHTHVGLFLDEDGLHDAAARDDARAARRWLSRFLEEGGQTKDGAAGDCALFAEVHAEASRNERVAAIVRETDARVRDNIATALAVLAPGERLARRRELLAGVILSLAHGLWHRIITDPGAPQVELAQYASQLMQREIDALVRDSREG